MRAASLALLAALVGLLAGDGSVRSAVNSGVDPLQILDLQVKANVYVILDTSGSMREPFQNSPQMGGDDPIAKMARAKSALNSFLSNNQGRYNFGFGTYNILSSEKVLTYDDTNNVTNPAGGGQDLDGPLMYVTLDNPTLTGSGAWNAWFTNQVNDLNTNYLETSTAVTLTISQNVYRSFERYRAQSGGAVAFNLDGTGCTAEPCRRYLNSRLLRDGVKFKWDTTQSSNKPNFLQTVTAATCPLPPVGLFPQDPNTDLDPTRTDLKRPCLQLETAGTPGLVSTWWYTSAKWQAAEGINGPSRCIGQATLENVAPCAVNNAAAIQAFLRPELPVDGSCPGTPPGFPCGVTVAPINGTATAVASTNPAATAGLDPNQALGIIAAQFTPLGNSLAQVNTNRATIFPVQPGLPAGVTQPNVVILVTDGADTCGGANAVTEATNLRNNGILTYVIAVSVASANLSTLDAIAQAGSGTNAFAVTDEIGLQNSLTTILSEIPVTGEFSDQQSITESVFELGGLVTPQPSPPISPLDPTTRYNATIPVLLQSTFEMPGYVGHLKAFRNVSGSTFEMWDAGDLLCQRVTGFRASTTAVPAVCDVGNASALVDSTAMGASRWTFDQLTAGATPLSIGTSTAKIRRRILTTTQNGVNPNYTPANLVSLTTSTSPPTAPFWSAQVPLWPPTTGSPGVDPGKQSPCNKNSNCYPAGTLDTALGISGLTFAQLQAQFGACRATSGNSAPDDCSETSGSPVARQLQLARKEAREMILAFTAGARVSLGSDGLPRRDSTSNSSTSSGRHILYEARPWVLAESTLAAPGIVSPPLQNAVAVHNAPEYALYRDGPRNTSTDPDTAVDGITAGFGLRNPDDDDQSASQSNTNLKPVMSVVLHATNHMLHAFRAGPNCGSTTTDASSVLVPSCTENGGEEMWAFVPYDQLGKLVARMQPQTRNNHTFVMAAPVRFSDVFVPGSFSKSIGGVATSGSGVWRTILLVGRGVAGKSLSAIDVTVPGPFTRLSNQALLPIAVWNRGNPDTNDGNVKTGANSYNNNANDYSGYLRMGETWSVPAVGFVTAANNVTARKSSGVEFVAWVGSGYSDVAGEGTTFFALDAVTGDIIGSSSQAAHTIAGGTSAAGIPNALVASPAAFAARTLSFNAPPSHPATERVTAVYFPDLHSRVFRFLPDSPTVPPTLFRDLSGDGDQPVANAVALLNFNSDGSVAKPHVFLEAGNDSRVPLPTGPPFFRMYGLRDDGAASAEVFTPIDFPSGFRGTVQPATVFNPQGFARVFYAGVRFNPITASNCVSTFDSVVFAVQGATGEAAYDLGGSDSRYVTLENQRVNAVRTAGGQLVVDFGLGVQNPPPPPAPPTTLPPAPAGYSNVVVGSAVPGTIPFKLGSSVCR